MNSKERVQASLNHKNPDKVPIDFGSSPVTGIHVLPIEKLREYYGLEKKPVKVIEPYQMLGEVDADLKEIMGIDVDSLSPQNTMFGFSNEGELKEFKTFWGQTVLVPKDFNTTTDENGDLLMHPEGDTSVPPSAKMPKASYFFDAIIRQDPIVEEKLDPQDNLEEFSPISDEDLSYWQRELDKKDKSKGIIANFGGTGLGDIALVPAMNLKHPKGIRDISEWYMSTVMRQDYIHSVFDKQTDIAVDNLKKIFKVVNNNIDVFYLCGKQMHDYFMIHGWVHNPSGNKETFEELYMPYYKKITSWIHENTQWKVFKHSCGAVETLIPSFIKAGFDILNPVQVTATGMDPDHLKDAYGDKITFWGGGIDTQKILAFGTPEEVENQVLKHCEIFSKNGGFVFNTVHNIQANVPLENVVSMINALKKFNGEK